MTLDDAVPHPQYRMCHSRIVGAPPAAVWDELCGVTMSALPVGYALEGMRLLPARLAGRKHRSLAGRTFLDVTPIPVLFSERPKVVISAGLSQAWRLLGGRTPPRLDAAALRAWSQPESVNLNEAPSRESYWVLVSFSWGGLIQDVPGSFGGAGGLRTKRSGWAV
jgi:hypothetical protein